MRLPRSVLEISQLWFVWQSFRVGFLVILTFLIQLFFVLFFIFIFAAFAMTALKETQYIRTALRDFAKWTGIKFFSTKKALLLSVSSQLSRLSRVLNVLENWTRKYFITYSLKIWFILTRSKQNWPLKWKNKSLLFLPSSACRSDRSLRSKRFRLVSKQRNTDEGDFRFCALLLAPLFSRSLTLVWLSPRSFLLNRTETLATQAKAIGSGLLSYDDTCMTEECREKHLALIIRLKIRRA